MMCHKDTMHYVRDVEGKNMKLFEENCKNWAKPSHPDIRYIDKKGISWQHLNGILAGISANWIMNNCSVFLNLRIKWITNILITHTCSFHHSVKRITSNRSGDILINTNRQRDFWCTYSYPCWTSNQPYLIFYRFPGYKIEGSTAVLSTQTHCAH